MYESVAVVGATGAVGTIIRQLLEERKFPFQRIKFLASARSAGKEISFSVQEMRLLSYMASSPGKMHTRRELLTEVWGYRPDVSSRTLDTHIKRLRDKFGAMAWMIQTVHGVGYRLAKPQQRFRRHDPTGAVARRR